MEEDMRKDLTECKTTIDRHREELHNINTRHIPLNIRSKLCCPQSLINITCRGRCDRYRIVVGFTTTYAISANHHWWYGFESRYGRGVLDTTVCDKVCR